MFDIASAGPSALASFMASLVEFVEALTIVLAVGVVRGWRSALLGTGAALVLLCALVLGLGRSLANIPLPVLQLVVGSLLLMFGMRWLRKAVLRAAGVLALHDEAESYRQELATLQAAGTPGRGSLDRIAFATSFKIVMLEGIEVVVIVIGIGASGGLLVPAAAGAVLALLVVIALGVWLHRPLARVPENALKFGVGVMLAAFGTFWVGEGVGLAWPGEDFVVLALIVSFLLLALLLVAACRGLHMNARPMAKKPSRTPEGALQTVAREVAGLFVDDGVLATGVLAIVAAGWAMVRTQAFDGPIACAIFTFGLMSILAWSSLRRARYR